MESKIKMMCETTKYKDGVFIKISDMRGVSLNDYKAMHYSKIARMKQNYRSVLDVALTQLLFDKSRYEMTEDGLVLKVPLFSSAKIWWGLGFNEERARDLGNYTQKILQDAMVGAKFFQDDNYKIVYEDSVFFMGNKRNCVSVFVLGAISQEYAHAFPTDGKSIADIVDELKTRPIVIQEDDGEF